jgi:hypothetical protein
MLTAFGVGSSLSASHQLVRTRNRNIINKEIFHKFSEVSVSAGTVASIILLVSSCRGVPYAS